MSHDESNRTDRRTFLQAGALAAATAASLAPGAKAQEAPARTPTIPRRTLGKTGIEVTMLEQGAVRAEMLDRIVRFSFASGVRVFYGPEMKSALPIGQTPRTHGTTQLERRRFQV